MGGFDSRYAPAYYEDTDLAFKVRKLGYKVFYQPLSEVIHYEGATSGTDLAKGIKKHHHCLLVLWEALHMDLRMCCMSFAKLIILNWEKSLKILWKD